MAEELKSSKIQLIERLMKWEEPLKNPLASYRESIEAAKLCCDARCEIERLMATLEEKQKTIDGWVRANGPGGWIDALRAENREMRKDLGYMPGVETTRDD